MFGRNRACCPVLCPSHPWARQEPGLLQWASYQELIGTGTSSPTCSSVTFADLGRNLTEAISVFTAQPFRLLPAPVLGHQGVMTPVWDGTCPLAPLNPVDYECSKKRDWLPSAHISGHQLGARLAWPGLVWPGLTWGRGYWDPASGSLPRRPLVTEWRRQGGRWFSELLQTRRP